MYKILVVEDDSRLNQAVCNFLNGSGYAATGVPHALAAYDAIYHTKFDLIISDIMMRKQSVKVTKTPPFCL